MSMLVPAKMDLSIKTKLVNPAGNLDTAAVPKLLAISYSYPPKRGTQSDSSLTTVEIFERVDRADL